VRGAPPQRLPAATSLLSGLPEAFLGNDFTVNLVRAFDDALAPVTTTLDDLDAYLDLRYAPDDFVRFAAGWLSPVIAERRSAAHLRAHLGDLREALLGRGTVAAVRAAVRACTGLEPEVRDTGGVAWSTRPQGPLPGRAAPLLEVDAPIADDEPDPDAVLELVRYVVDDVRPAHVPAVVRRAPSAGATHGG
jgi:phage tail-like protein